MSEHKKSEILSFYQEKYNEDERMQRQPLEFLRCKEIIFRYLSDAPMQIADIGGATGAFSYWLAEQGHSVHLLDFTPAHIEQARQNAQKHGRQLASYTCADARMLPYGDEQFDLVLLMGPLYHLQQKEDRLACLQEARRVLKPGGTVLCEVIGQYANLFELLTYKLMDDEKFLSILEENLQTGRHDPGDSGYFTAAFFHSPQLLSEELREAGFSDIALMAVEGFAFAGNGKQVFEEEKHKELLLSLIRQTERIPSLLGVSGHVMAAAVK